MMEVRTRPTFHHRCVASFSAISLIFLPNSLCGPTYRMCAIRRLSGSK